MAAITPITPPSPLPPSQWQGVVRTGASLWDPGRNPGIQDGRTAYLKTIP